MRSNQSAAIFKVQSFDRLVYSYNILNLYLKKHLDLFKTLPLLFNLIYYGSAIILGTCYNHCTRKSLTVYVMCFHSFMEFTLIAFTDKEVDKFIALCHRLLFNLVTVAIVIIL